MSAKFSGIAEQDKYRDCRQNHSADRMPITAEAAERSAEPG